MIKELRQYWTAKNPNRSNTRYIVIHHAAAVYAKGGAVQSIYNYHKSKWSDYGAAGYHIICQEESDNSISCNLINNPDVMGAGVALMNGDTFHICLATNFRNAVPEQRWIDAALIVVAWARERYPSAIVVGHRDIAKPGYGTSCPGDAWTRWKNVFDQPTSPVTDYPIVGGTNVAPEILLNSLNRNSKHLTLGERNSIISAYTAYGDVTAIGNLYPFAQAVHETGWFASERFVKSYNPAGLGATDDGAWGATFETISAGVLAQYAHLLCYAKREQELNYIQKQISLLSPRRDALRKAYGLGVALNNWHGLTQKWNTPGPTGTQYANRIIAIAERVRSGAN
jgi:hypothetical protein